LGAALVLALGNIQYEVELKFQFYTFWVLKNFENDQEIMYILY
jgi:hypothetical protein